MNLINCASTVLYITEILLVHLDLFDIRRVIGGVDLVLLLVVRLTVETLGKQRGQMLKLYP